MMSATDVISARGTPTPPSQKPRGQPTLLDSGTDEDPIAILVPSQNPDDFIPTHPLEESPALFLELADCKGDDELAAFATKFGVLGLWHKRGIMWEEPEVTLPDGSKVLNESEVHSIRSTPRSLKRS